MPSKLILSRRAFATGLAGGAALLALPRAALAMTEGEAKVLVDKTVAQINEIISSGKSEQAMYVDFEKLFAKYADVPTIARSVLGPAAKSASDGQMSSYTKAFQGYISRKYGRRFR